MKIPIFRSSHEGYGDARVSSRRFSYHRNARGWDPRFPGELRIGPALSTPLSVTSGQAPIAAVEWEDSSGIPLVLFTSGALTRKLQNGAVSSDTTLNGGATTGVLHDDGSGVPYYYTGNTGSSAGDKVQRRDISATLTTMTNLVANKLLSLGGDFYGTRIPASGTAASAVWKIAAGTSITQAIALPTGTVVGFAGTAINNLASVNRSVVALKPEGIFTYDRGTDAWVPHGRIPQHRDNGKAYWYEDDDLIVALGNGGAVRFDGENVTEYDLLPPFVAVPDEDTTPQIIACATQMRQWGVVVTAIGAKRARKVATLTGQVVCGKSTDSGSTWATDYTSQVNDFDETSEASLDALATATDRIIIARDQPFHGFYLEVSDANANTAAMSVSVWNGSSWVAATVIDLTGGSVSLIRSGWVLFDPAATDPIDAGWATGSFTIGGQAYADVYAVRVSFDANLSATVRISGIDMIPWRPNIDPLVAASASAPDPLHTYDGLDRASGIPHVLFSRRAADGSHIVQDMGGVETVDVPGAVLYGRGRYPGPDDRQLLVFCSKSIALIRVTPDDRPQMYGWIQLATSGLLELAALDLDDEARKAGPWQPGALSIEGRDWRGTGYVYGRWLDGAPWTRLGSFDTLPVKLDASGMGLGRWIQIAVAFSLTAAQAVAPGTPRILSIDLDAEPVEGRVRSLPRKTPAVV